MRRYKPKMVVHDGGERLPMVIDTQSGMPVDLALEYLIANFRGNAPNTILRAAESICLTLEWGHIFLRPDGIIGRLLAGNTLSPVELYGLSEYLRTSFRTDTKKTTDIVVPETHEIRLIRAKEFCLHLMQECQARIPLSDSRSATLIERIKLMKSSFEELISTSPVVSYSEDSLDVSEREALIDLIDPNSPSNPFYGDDTRKRNCSMIECMLHLGLRPGELRNLKLRDIKFGTPTTVSVIRNPHPKDDPRPNPAAVKRKSRLLPLDHPVAAEHLREYMQDVRPRLEAKAAKPTPFLFISIGNGTPLSSRAIQMTLEKLRKPLLEKLPFASNSVARLMPKSMRHTFSNDIEEDLLSQGIDEEDRRQHLMQLRGDSSPKSVEPYIQRSRAKQAKKHLRQRQRQIFDKQSARNDDIPY